MHVGQGRGIALDYFNKSLKLFFITLSLDRDTFGMIEDVAGEAELHRCPINEWTKTDALHGALDHYTPS